MINPKYFNRMKAKELNIVNLIIEYESGELGVEDTIRFFARLIKSGMAWTLQGHYGRTAQSFIEEGYISLEGEVNEDKLIQTVNGYE